MTDINYKYFWNPLAFQLRFVIMLFMSTTYKTKDSQTVSWGWGFQYFVKIPKGMKCVPATNLPAGSGYWLKNIPPEMKGNKQFKSWFDTYGFLITPDEIK